MQGGRAKQIQNLKGHIGCLFLSESQPRTIFHRHSRKLGLVGKVWMQEINLESWKEERIYEPMGEVKFATALRE